MSLPTKYAINHKSGVRKDIGVVEAPIEMVMIICKTEYQLKTHNNPEFAQSIKHKENIFYYLV